jgi:hypothetical protein
VPEIRPFQPEDLPGATPLVRSISLDWLPDGDIEAFLRRTILDDPWRDEELPSLVATEKSGEILGFIGSQVRRFRSGERELRGVCPSHLVVVQDGRAGAAGALLARRLLNAGQDFSFSDTASDDVVRIWRTFGGHVDAARACDWLIVLRPGRWLGGVAGRSLRRRSVGRDQIPVGALPLHAVPGVARRRWPEPDPEVHGEDAGTEAIVSSLPETTRGLRIHGDYDSEFLDHVLADVKSMLGTPVVRLVRRGEQAIGWYIYVFDGQGPATVLQIGASEAEAEAVVGEMVEHAKSQGATLISGRLEPHLVGPLRRRLAVVGFARQPTIHSRDAELLGVLQTPTALLTRLDSEWFAS